MPLEALPPVGSNDWYSHYTSLHNNVANLLIANPGATVVGGVHLESFREGLGNDSDNACLGRAMTFCNNLSNPPPILFYENRDYGPFTTQRTLYSGFRMQGLSIASQHRSALSQPQRILVNTSGPWLMVPDGDTFDVQISGLSFYSQSSTCDFMASANTNANLWTSVIGNCGWSLFRHVFGSPTLQLLNTGCDFLVGFNNINNSRNVSCTFGGSDSTFGLGGTTLIDSPNYATSTRAHLVFNYQQKGTVGSLFITAESLLGGSVAAIEVTGSTRYAAHLTFLGTRIEGRNENQPALGDIIRVSGGAKPHFRDCWISYGMSGGVGYNTARGAANGIVHVSGGSRVLLDGCYYSRAANVAETVPFAYATGTGSHIRLRNIETAVGGSTSWTGLPRYQVASGATASVDDSVQL